MSDEWRSFLYYPLGLLPSIFFTLRFIIQWVRSERQKTSVVHPLFWKLSLAGNSLQFLHFFIQLQYPFALIQIVNGVIAWRNLNLMQTTKPQASLKTTLLIFLSVIVLTTAAYGTQVLFLNKVQWLAIPASASIAIVPIWLHLIGICGQGLFASRFWIQWWLAEKKHKSELPAIFWWFSLGGNILSLIYFISIQDTVSILNNSFGTIPYARNIILIRRANAHKIEAS